MIDLANDKLEVRIKKPGDSWPTVVSIDIIEGKYRLQLFDSDGVHVTHDIFDHLHEALESMTGIVRTLEKEIAL